MGGGGDEGPWRKMMGSERGRLMWKLADLVEQHLEEFAEIEVLTARLAGISA
jgi:phenylacetaldehyde dehydrogenase